MRRFAFWMRHPGPRLGTAAWIGSIPPRTIALGIWILSVCLAAAAVAMALTLRSAGGVLPEVYLGNAWGALVLPAAGLTLVSRPAARTIGYALSAGGLGGAVATFAFSFAAWTHHLGQDRWAGAGEWLGSWTWLAAPLAVACVTLLLPNGDLTGWRRPVLIAVVTAFGLRAVVTAFTGESTTDNVTGAAASVPNPLAVAALEPLVIPVFVACTFLVLMAQIAGSVRLSRLWRAAERPREAAAFLVAAAWVAILPWAAVPVIGEYLDVLSGSVFAGLVVAGILLNPDMDADMASGSATLWISLTLCIAAAYLVTVTLLAAVVHRAGGASVAIAASGLVALVVAPLRGRLQRRVDVMLYGARADPYASVARFSSRLEESVTPEDVLPTVVRTITEDLRLPYAAFRLMGRAGLTDAAECGAPKGDLVTLPVTYLGEQVGELVVSTPGPGIRLRPAEKRLLADLARQSGPAAHGLVTLAEIQRSREHLVTAREEERHALRRELHDDLGATLTGAALGIDAATSKLPEGSDAAEQLVRVRGVMTTAIADVRRIIEGLRPPALDEVGLVAAIRDRAQMLGASGGMATTVVASDLPSLPAAVEVAAYHVAVEGVSNAMRHAEASQVQVRLDAIKGVLHLTLVDDGTGVPTDAEAGEGLVTMRERAEELGGTFRLTSSGDGTTLTVTFPLPVPTIQVQP